MFADLQITGLELDPSALEVYLAACLAVAGLVVLFNKATGAGSTGAGQDLRARRELLRPPAPLPEKANPGADAAAESKPNPGAAAGGPVRQARPARADPPTDPRERRRSSRRKGKPVKVLLVDPAGTAPPEVGWVIDRSRGGLGLIAPRPLAPGTVLGVKAAHAPDDSDPVQVEVRTCRPRGRLWRVGCRFTAELPWGVLLLFG